MDLRQAVEEITQPLKTGCRLTHDAEGHVYVQDFYKWTHHHTLLLHHLRPNAQLMSIQSSSQSLSGFVLILKECKEAHLSLRLWIVAGACCLALAVSLKTPPWAFRL